MDKVLIQKEKAKKGKWAIILLDIVLVLVILFLILMYFALQNSDQDFQSTELKKSLPAKVLTGAFSGQEISLDSNEMENFLNFVINQYDGTESNPMSLNIKTEQDSEAARIYIPFSYKNLNFMLSSKIKVKSEDNRGQIKIEFEDPKVGKLPIPIKLMKNVLNSCTGQELDIKDKVLYLDSHFTIKVGNKPVSLEIGDLKILNGNFVFKLHGAAGAIKSFVNRTLNGILGI